MVKPYIRGLGMGCEYHNIEDYTEMCHLFDTRLVFKGIHTIYFSSSLYIINQKPMIHRSDFHCITTWGCMFFWVKFGHAFAYFVVSFSLASWRYYSIQISIFIAKTDCAL